MASSRREFLNQILTAGLAIVAAYIVYPVLSFFTPPSVARAEADKIFVTTTNVMGLNTAKFFRFRDRAAVLVHLPDDKYTSLSAKCTHMGCTVAFEPDGDYFLCQCHGSKFAMSGKVLKGPATRPLPVYAVSMDGNKIYVSVKKQVA